MDVIKIAKEYTNQINLSENKEEETKRILKEIECLLADNQITVQGKKELLQKLFELLSQPPRLKNGQFLLLEQFENKNYLQMIKSVLSFIDSDDVKKEAGIKLNEMNKKK